MFEIANTATQFAIANVAAGAAINFTKKMVRTRRNRSTENSAGTPLNYAPLFNG